MNIDLLYQVADSIKTGWELCGSKWQNCESEMIALQTIAACKLNHKNHGDAFSWYGNGLRRVSGGGLADNPRGLRMLIDDGCIVVEEYTGDLEPPEGTHRKDGSPLILRATDRLLEYAAKMCKIPID